MQNLQSSDLKKIDDAIKFGVPLTVTTYSYSHEVQSKLDELVTYFLTKIPTASKRLCYVLLK